MSPNNENLWITWETQRRNKELAKSFGCNLKVFDYSNKPSINRYIECIKQTYNCLKTKPSYLFVQCPSIILCFLCVILKPIFGYKLIIDAHNIIIKYLHEQDFIISLLTKFCLRFCDFLIITNEGMIPQIPILKNKILILPDRLPLINIPNEIPKILSKEKTNVIFISSFARDEPIFDFLEVAKYLTNEIRFFITGKKSKAGGLLTYESEDIIFTDYLSEQKFESLISHSDVNIDLTTENNLLVCGSYETLSVGVPGILSDTEIQRKTFPKGFIFTKLDSASLKNSILKAVENKSQLKIELNDYKSEFIKKWDAQFQIAKSKVFDT